MKFQVISGFIPAGEQDERSLTLGSIFETRESPRVKADSGDGCLAQALGGLVHQRHWTTKSGLLVSKTGCFSDVMETTAGTVKAHTLGHSQKPGET